MIHQPEMNYPKNVGLDFPEIEFKRILKYILPIKRKLSNKNIIGEQKHYRGNPELRKQINSSKEVHTFFAKTN